MRYHGADDGVRCAQIELNRTYDADLQWCTNSNDTEQRPNSVRFTLV